MRRIISAILVICLFLHFGISFASETTDLLPGSKGDAVKELQFRLAELGYYSDSLEPPYSYGNNTKAAVIAFQEANALEPTGIALADVLSVLYSPNAIPAPPKPDMEIVKFTRNNYNLNITFKNNTNEAIKYFEYHFIAFKHDMTTLTDHTTILEPYNDDCDSIYNTYYPTRVTINPGKTYHLSFPLDSSILSTAPVLAIGVRAYTTNSNKLVELDEYDISYYTTTGETIWPRERIEIYDELSEQELQQARSIQIGYKFAIVPYYLTDNYLLPEGEYIVEVFEGSLAEMAGLRSGDVILKLDSENIKGRFTSERAKLRMLNGIDVTVEYWRNNQILTTILSLNPETMSEISQSITPDEENFSIADELMKYAGLLEKGLITSEEYDKLKQKLLD